MRVLGLVLLTAVVTTSGCTSVKMVQREGCWVKRTEMWPKRVREELGPCATAGRGPWSEDRLVRLVQECIASSDTRWHAQALVAWTRKEPLPERPSGDSILQDCLNKSAHAVVADNETLKQRLADVSSDRDAIRARNAEEQARNEEEKKTLLAAQEKLAAFLGEAAKKTSPPATATAYASSDGKARTESPAPATAPVTMYAGFPAAANACQPAAPAPAFTPAPPGPVPSPMLVEVTDPARASGPPPVKARTPRSVKREPPPAPSCDVCPPSAAAPTPAPNGNGEVTPTVAPANRDGPKR